MRRSIPHLARLRGFTLVELLIVIAIISLLLTMTVLAVNFALDSDRVRAGASQVQSFLSGARDRAIYARDLRGVRFYVDPVNTRAVSAMAYIQPGQRWSIGNVNLQRRDANNDDVADGPDVVEVAGFNLGWWQLKRRGLIVDGTVIEIPKDSNSFYEIDTSLIDIDVASGGLPGYAQSPPVPDRLLLKIPYSEPGGSDLTAVIAQPGVTYELQLPAQLLPQEPSLLPEGIVIDLDGSSIPIIWRPAPEDSFGQFSPYMDVFFSPRGNVVGSAASAGLLQLYICDTEDSMHLKELYLKSIDKTAPPNVNSPLDTFEAQVRSPGKFIPAADAYGTWTDPDGPSMPAPPLYPDAASAYLPKDRRLVTLFAQTGEVVINEIDPTDVGMDGFADNPYYFSLTGSGVK